METVSRKYYLMVCLKSAICHMFVDYTMLIIVNHSTEKYIHIQIDITI